MPDFWEFPTVSMGLGPINAIYQARFNRYLLNRELRDTSRSRVWAFLGDGEMDEPEALGAIGVAAREELDNLIFVVNCNLQRLDGPVRGNGKIMQELESYFLGAGWNVIKVVWGRDWDPLLAQDVDGVLLNQMNTTPDGQFQTYSTSTGEYIREHFFGGDPRLRRMVKGLSDDDLRAPVTRWSRLPQALRGVQVRDLARGPADGHPHPHHQGLDARRRLRGAQRHPPDEEADQGGAEGLPRPALPADPRRRPRRRHPAVLPPGAGLGRDRVHARAPRSPRGFAAQPGRAFQAARSSRPRRRSTCSRADPASRPSPPRWRSCAC